MSPSALDALRALRLDYAPVSEDVWGRLTSHVDGLQPEAEAALLAGLDDADRSDGPSPLGLVVSGRKGAGKTHLMQWFRHEVQARRGYFFLIELLNARSFWECVILSLIDGLHRPWSGELNQAQALQFLIGTKIGASEELLLTLTGGQTPTPEILDEYQTLLDKHTPDLPRAARLTARALVLAASPNLDHQDLADVYFQSQPDRHNTRTRWRLPHSAPSAEELVLHLTSLMALVGPVVIAFDRIDHLVRESTRNWSDDMNRSTRYEALQDIGAGLLTLRERTRRTLTVVACQPTSWLTIRELGADIAADRFRELPDLLPIASPALARELVAQRLEIRYRQARFNPPTPTWPVADDAFESAVGHTPRRVLADLDEHLRTSERSGDLELVAAFGGDEPPEHVRPPTLAAKARSLEELDHVFAELKAASSPAMLRSPEREDIVWSEALQGGLWAWVVERGSQRDQFELDPPQGPRAGLHARLRMRSASDPDRECSWAFRAISARHHSATALSRLDKACVLSGISPDHDDRHLVILRNGPWSTGIETQEAVKLALEAGAVQTQPNDDDLRALLALRALRDTGLSNLEDWLVDRQVATGLQVFEQLRSAVSRGYGYG